MEYNAQLNINFLLESEATQCDAEVRDFLSSLAADLDQAIASALTNGVLGDPTSPLAVTEYEIKQA